MEAKQISYYPGPTNLHQVQVGSEFASIGSVADFRATLWGNGSATLHVSSGALSMQLSATYEELHALREMLSAVMEDVALKEAA